MNAVMLRRSARELRWTVFWYALGLAIYSLGILSFYPNVRENRESFQDLIKNYPEGLLRAFGIGDDFTQLSSFLGAEFLNVVWPIIVAVFVIMAGTAVVAQEIERGTVEIWLSVPEPRWQLLAAKLVVLSGAILILVVVTVVSIAAGAIAVGEPFTLRELLALMIALFGFPIAVAGFAVLLSSLASERGKAAGVAGGLMLAFYLIWVLGALVDGANWLRYLSIFTAFKPQQALEDGSVPLAGTLALFGIGLACFAAALAVFQRRDAIS